MNTIYLIRHGETLWNIEQRFQGHKNSPLSNLGIQQAQKVGVYLKDKNIKHIFCSDLERALLTKKELQPYLKPQTINIRPELREMCLGLFEGQHKKTIIEQYPKEFTFFNYNPLEFVLEGAETFKNLEYRMLLSFKEALSLHGNILIISHSLSIRVLLNYLAKRDLKDYQAMPTIGQCAINTINKTTLEIKSINENAHFFV